MLYQLIYLDKVEKCISPLNYTQPSHFEHVHDSCCKLIIRNMINFTGGTLNITHLDEIIKDTFNSNFVDLVNSLLLLIIAVPVLTKIIGLSKKGGPWFYIRFHCIINIAYGLFVSIPNLTVKRRFLAPKFHLSKNYCRIVMPVDDILTYTPHWIMTIIMYNKIHQMIFLYRKIKHKQRNRNSEDISTPHISEADIESPIIQADVGLREPGRPEVIAVSDYLCLNRIYVAKMVCITIFSLCSIINAHDVLFGTGFMDICKLEYSEKFGRFMIFYKWFTLTLNQFLPDLFLLVGIFLLSYMLLHHNGPVYTTYIRMFRDPDVKIYTVDFYDEDLSIFSYAFIYIFLSAQVDIMLYIPGYVLEDHKYDFYLPFVVSFFKLVRRLYLLPVLFLTSGIMQRTFFQMAKKVMSPITQKCQDKLRFGRGRFMPSTLICRPCKCKCQCQDIDEDSLTIKPRYGFGPCSCFIPRD